MPPILPSTPAATLHFTAGRRGSGLAQTLSICWALMPLCVMLHVYWLTA